jgi:hypothetical protein
MLPVLTVAWANCHGAFILAAPFFCATAAGELLNRRFAPEAALPGRGYRHLLAAWSLALLASAATPYGLRYPGQLIQEYVFHLTPRPDMAWNHAHQSPLAEEYYVGLFVVIAALFAGGWARTWRGAGGARAHVDWAVTMAFLAYVPLYFLYIRTTPFLAPVFAGGFFFLWGQPTDGKSKVATTPIPIRRRTGPLFATIVLVILGARAGFDAWRRPALGSWLGFGIGYVNPVAEAEFLSRSHAGGCLINLFNSGGYLLWRLWPQYRVMVDARSFPYLSWFEQQRQFAHGEDFDHFLAASGAGAAVVELRNETVWRLFLKAPGWKVAYYGPAAAVFVRDTVEPEQRANGRDIAPERFARLHNAETAWQVFVFATAVGDFRTAWTVEEQLQGALSHQANPDMIRRARDYRAAHRALRAAEFGTAERLFMSSLDGREMCDRDRLIITLLASARQCTEMGQGSRLSDLPQALIGLAAVE